MEASLKKDMQKWPSSQIHIGKRKPWWDNRHLREKKKGEQYLRHTMLEYDRFLSFLDLLESASDVKPELSLRGGGYSRLENIA